MSTDDHKNAEELRGNLEKLNALTQKLVSAMADRKQGNPALDGPDQQFYTKAAAAYFSEMMSDPARLIEAQVGYWTDTLKDWSDAHGASHNPDQPKDNRFANALWTTNPYFNQIKQQYLSSAKTINAVTQDLSHLSSKDRDRATFFANQFTDLLSPTNFLGTNPDAMEKAMETNGQSLIDGLENLIRDLDASDHGLCVTLSDPDAFVVGQDIATTPGSVVYKNRMFQLIQYAPTTETVYENPILILPPWINKYYILDLKPQNSLIKYLVEQGRTVFVVSWVNPDASHADAGFDTYLEDGFLEALTQVLTITGRDTVNAVGYCIGGTLLACGLAYLAETDQAQKVRRATFFTTMTDFEEPGELGAFIEEGFMDAIVEEVRNKGYLDSYFMSRAFSFLRANDLIYAPAIRSYMLGQKPPAFDLLHWNSDSTNLPGRMAKEYLEYLYRDNDLANGRFNLLGQTVKLADISIPIFAVGTIADHIAPWKSCFKGLCKTGGDKAFVLSESGHIAGIVNPPTKNKYGHWTNPAVPTDPDTWLDQAQFHKGSWWDHWCDWLSDGKSPTVPARIPGDSGFPVLEQAPGTYVLRSHK